MKNCLLCKEKIGGDQYINSETIKFCVDCQVGFTITHDKRKISDVSENYDEDYISQYLKRSSEIEGNFFKGIEKIQQNLTSGEVRVLDVGCGVGYFLKTLGKTVSTYSLYGIEPNPKLAKQAQNFVKSAKIINSSIENAALKENYFDVITFWDVLEHVYDPIKTLKSTHKLLKKNGIVVIQAPNYRSLMTFMTKENWDWWLPPDHLYHFSPKSMELLLKKSGFKLKYMETRESKEIFVKNIRAQIKGNSFFTKATRKMFGVFLNLIYPLIEIVTTVTKTGGLVFVVAQKV